MNKQLFSKEGRVTTVTAATPGNGTDRTVELQYSDQKVIGNGSFGVVYLAKLVNENNENVAIKKVLQDKRFKVYSGGHVRMILLESRTSNHEAIGPPEHREAEIFLLFKRRQGTLHLAATLISSFRKTNFIWTSFWNTYLRPYTALRDIKGRRYALSIFLGLSLLKACSNNKEWSFAL